MAWDNLPTMNHIRRILFVLCVLCGPTSLPVQADTARLAYIISQTDYDGVTRQSGAKDMAKAFARLNFTTQHYKNLDHAAFAAALKEIAADSEGAEAAIVYFSGFALTVDGQGAVLPVDFAAKAKSTPSASAIAPGA